MLNNHTHEIRECYQQAVHCVQEAEAQSDPKLKKQFLELTRRWLLLADGLSGPPLRRRQSQNQSNDNDQAAGRALR
jgi:hypothetical protein